MTDKTAGTTTSTHSPSSPSSSTSPLSSPTASSSRRRRRRSISSTSNRDETMPTTTTKIPASLLPPQALPRRPQSQPTMAMSIHEKGDVAGAAKPASIPPPLPLGNVDGDHRHHYPPPPPPPPPSYRHPDDLVTDTTPSRLSLRKRAASIDVEEANHPRNQKFGLYTPTTARADDGGGGGPGDMICLCTKAPKVPRPRNAFILYRQHWQGYVAAQNPGLANPDISKLIGEKWRAQPEKVKNEWKQLAEEEKIRHQRQYPDYRYQPRRGKNVNGRPTSASGEAPGRCPKCGGRYIATPRTPSTPFTPLPSNPPSGMQPYITPNPRVIETDHLRRGSASSTMSVDGHGRRYTQPHMRDIDEDYDTMSPTAAAPPEGKRRRYNGPHVFIPGSPPMGYMHVDSRYPQRPSVSGPPMSASGYGPGPLPRPPMPYRQQPSHPNQPHYPNHPHMQPPPRPTVSYQQPAQTPTRPNPGFDESLRLPPLQTQVPNSPPLHSEPGSARAMSAVQPSHGTGLGIINGGAGPIRQPLPPPPPPPPPQPQQAVPTRWPFLLKLDVLRSISPPLQPPGPGGPVFETRGPIIAVEGAVAAPLLREVAAVVEQALAVSGEYAVRLWSDENNNNNSSSNSTLHPSGEDASGRDNNSSSNNYSKDSSGGSGNNASADGKPAEKGAGAGAGAQQRKTTLLSPIAHYMARMLRWHKTSEDLIGYITTYAQPAAAENTNTSANSSGTKTKTLEGGGSAQQQQQQPPSSSTSTSSSPSTATTTAAAAASSSATAPPKLPVAVLADGYSLTYSDRYAGALHVSDAYRADDHWQWVATLWRGVVGADLTVYVKRSETTAAAAAAAAAEVCVEFANPAVLVLRVGGSGSGSGGLDEKTERRLGFEIMEWVRGGSYQAGFVGGGAGGGKR